ncbi:DUF2891 domain-containing protein [Streptomyces sp. NBC_01433]|uniref:DUF2891 domain-containing protein n=1 Tax=Streptomyces sp. NBC_01433 TaxID=2903864 RepID=UPI0022559E95|nr:DUF2891 domain-containing protein [Streptomyces sp. NBC_01433]MCX4675239.1 DUF2891 domain-containing protein [Streptomyces sp. NBC_01433]
MPSASPSPVPAPFPAPYAVPFAELALANVVREYPNAPAHLYAGPEELVEPRTLHPAFYGGFDWHSTVHMHWLLVRLLRRFSSRGELPATLTTRIHEVLNTHLTPQNLAVEADYLRGRPHFERPYGWAWLVALAAECRVLGTPDGDRWADALAPAVATVGDLLTGWLPRATYPIRHGIHGNSAFGLGLILDAGERAGLTAPVLDAVADRIRDWFTADHDAPTHWEPSGQDFLSPALTEADAVRRVLPVEEFRGWLAAFLPGLATSSLLTPPVVSDHADPYIGHLLGLTLSRAAALRTIAAALPDGPERTALTESADAHLTAGLPTVSSGDFSSDHWLATFAALALDTAPGH